MRLWILIAAPALVTAALGWALFSGASRPVLLGLSLLLAAAALPSLLMLARPLPGGEAVARLLEPWGVFAYLPVTALAVLLTALGGWQLWKAFSN